MEPLSALSVAANIVQFVDFTSKLISESTKLYKSVDGELDEHTDLRRVTESLAKICRNLERPIRSSVPESCQPLHERELRAMAHEATNVTKELVEALDSVRLGNKDRTRWRSCLQALKIMWSDDRIRRLKESVRGFRQQLVLNILVAMREETYSAQTDLNDQLLQLATRSHFVGAEFLKHIEESRRWQQKLTSAIRKSHSQHVQQFDEAFVPSNIAKVGLVSKADDFTQLILRTLKFQEIKDRYELIAKAHQRTFEWIFGNPRPDTFWTNFSEWLKGHSNLYWITGKAGAGKSTLMKFLFNDQRTHAILSTSYSVPIVTATYFFWNSGTFMQMSQQGLVQSLLHEMLLQCREYAPIAFPDRWEIFSLLGIQPTEPWTWAELLRAFRRLIEKVGRLKQFFFLIDGLDEYDGDHSDLIAFLKQLLESPNVKMCVSSRPWVIFEDAFKSSPSLLVHELTYPDIKLFISTHFEGNEGYRELQSEEPEYAAGLVDEIAKKSSGVFLWVSLVVKSLLAGLTNGDRVADLQERLDELPSGLEELFQRIIDKIEPAYKQHASELFQILRASKTPITILDLAFADQYHTDHAISHAVAPLDENQLHSKLDRMRRRLNSRCKGLLEVTSGDLSETSLVQYLHRTVHDFIENEEIWAQILAATPSFDPYLPLCISQLMRLKTTDEITPPNLRDLTTWCIQYADDAKRSPVTKRVKLLDNLDESAQILTLRPIRPGKTFLDLHATPYPFLKPHWTYITYFSSSGFLQPGSFMNLMVCCQLRWYVEAKMSGVTSIKNSSSLVPLLFTAVLGYNGASGFFDGRTVFNHSQPDPELVKFLLEKGADPNEIFQGMTLTQQSQLVDYHNRAVIENLLKQYSAKQYSAKQDGAKDGGARRPGQKKETRWSLSKFSFRRK